jgi:hypothetical protein
MQGCRFAAREIENCVISILIDALMASARLLEALAITDIAGDQIRKFLGPCALLARTLRDAPGERAEFIQALVERVFVDENRIAIKVRCGALLAGNVPANVSEASNGTRSSSRPPSTSSGVASQARSWCPDCRTRTKPRTVIRR